MSVLTKLVEFIFQQQIDCSFCSQINSINSILIMAAFTLEDALAIWTNLGKHLLFVWLCISSIKMSTRRIMRQDELSSVVRLEWRTREDISSRRITRPLV